jgi:membrane-bound lytic murein transglycosylase F
LINYPEIYVVKKGIKNKRKIWWYALPLFAICFFFPACNDSDNSESNKQLINNETDLPGILKRGKLVVLAENSSTSFFIYKGKKMGFEYEVLREFAEDLGVSLEVKIIDDLDAIDEQLQNGECDVLACNFTVTKSRQSDYAFSEPYFQTNQVLIQRKRSTVTANKENQAPFIDDPLQLAKKKIHIWKGSSYFTRLMHLQEEIGDTIYVRPTQGFQGVEELIELVADGQIDYTIAERNVASINEQYYDNIDCSTPISFRQNISFALRKDCPILLKRLNSWLKKFMQRESFAYIKRKYFEQIEQVASYQDEFHSSKRGAISPFDDILKQESAKYGIDWRLVAAVIYHESKFNPNARGFGGAYGLMQFMPGTGPRFGVHPSSPPAIQIKGGVKYIARINDLFKDISNKEERNKFILASYNAGSNHVKDAQKLAEKRGLNPRIWENNVGQMLLNLGKHEYYSDPVVKSGALRGARTYNYVKLVISKYESFKTLARE